MVDQGSARTILIADDDDDMIAILSCLLEGAGYRVRCASDGDQCVRMAAEEPPDLILLDLMMPSKSGFDACRELRQIPALRDVPILALTAFGQNVGEVYDVAAEKVSASIRDYLEKPVEPNVLLERIAEALAGEETV